MAAVRTLTDPKSTPRVPSPGDLIAGKYRVESIVGTGGMGTVLAAKHMQLGQSVAIKVLQADESHREEAVARFLREGRAAASLTSDHVVRIHDVGVLDDGLAFMVMELLRGRDLASHLSHRGALPIEEAAEYVLQACEAIAEAHAHGIVHRDLKPSNLFLSHRSDGQPLIKVLDFGISKSIVRGRDAAAEVNLTTTRSVMGSPAYMSPEHVRDAKNVDHRTDIWSLGVILYELLAGEPAFNADTLPAVCAAIAADPPPPLRAARPDVPPELEALIVRCLEKDPKRRFQSVVELVAALAPFAPRHRTNAIIIVPNALGDGGSPDSNVTGASPTLRAAEPSRDATPEPSSGLQEVEKAPPRSANKDIESTLMSRQSMAPPPPAPAGRRWSTRLVLAVSAGVLAIAVGLAWSRSRAIPVQPVPSPTPQPTQTSFNLILESTPSGAEITEKGEKLGATPALITIERSTVRDHPRLFVLRSPGYQPYALVQKDSDSDLRLVAALSPEPARLALPAAPNAGKSPSPNRPVEAKPPDSARMAPSAAGADAPAPDIRMNR